MELIESEREPNDAELAGNLGGVEYSNVVDELVGFPKQQSHSPFIKASPVQLEPILRIGTEKTNYL